MPCNSDYMNATDFEVELSRVACLLDELDGKRFSPEAWDGYHRLVYSVGLSKSSADAMVSRLCSRLKTIDVSKHSLEMQIWWRDHQMADEARMKRERDEEALEMQRAKALAKLTTEDKKALGL